MCTRVHCTACSVTEYQQAMRLPFFLPPTGTRMRTTSCIIKITLPRGRMTTLCFPGKRPQHVVPLHQCFYVFQPVTLAHQQSRTRCACFALINHDVIGFAVGPSWGMRWQQPQKERPSKAVGGGFCKGGAVYALLCTMPLHITC